MTNSVSNIPDLVETLLEGKIPPPFELVAVEWEKLGTDDVLRLLIDKPEGISLDETERLSELISPMLDEMRPDPFPPAGYLLEVSSPGTERPLRKPEDFVRALNETVLIKLYQKIKGQKEFVGQLVKADATSLTLQVHEKARSLQIEIPLEAISKATTLELP